MSLLSKSIVHRNLLTIGIIVFIINHIKYKKNNKP